MTNQVVKVKKEKLAACMTCPLCNGLLNEATTISLCLHTFCRKCIYEKLSDEEEDDCCPVCNIDLGCVPVEKLRPDHNLQDIRAKLFPLKRRKIKAPEVMPSLSPPIKRKERSLSSLVVNTPKVPMQAGLTGKRTKAAKKAAAVRGSSFSIMERVKKEKDSQSDLPESSGSPDSLNQIAHSKRQNSSFAEPSNNQIPRKDFVDEAEAWEGKADIWTPLNCLLEAANRTKYSKFTSHQTCNPKSEQQSTPESDTFKHQTKAKSGSMHDETKPSNGQHPKATDEKNEVTLVSGPVKRRRLRAKEMKRALSPKEQFESAQAMLDTAMVYRNNKKCPVWFSLVPSADREGDVPLPQISACYLRIKDGNLPVSIIQKYIIKKLNLTSETEVNIMIQGQPVLPTLKLHDLVDLWLQTSPSTSRKLPATVGASAKEFVMAVSYSGRIASS